MVREEEEKASEEVELQKLELNCYLVVRACWVVLLLVVFEKGAVQG